MQDEVRLSALKRRKEAAMARAVEKANETSPSQIGVTVIEKMTSKLVLAVLLLLLAYSSFYDLPQISLRDSLYRAQLNSLLLLERATGDTNSTAFSAVLAALVGNSTNNLEYLQWLLTFNEFNNKPYVAYVKIAGKSVFNMSEALGLNYSIVASRRQVELVYTREACEAYFVGAAVADADCDNVVVYDRRRMLQDELRDQILITLVMVLIITVTIGMMAVDMQHMILNPIDRIAKLLKTLTGRHWRKKSKKEGVESDSLSIVKVAEAFELETYYGLRALSLLLLDLERAFGISMGRYRQKLWTVEHVFDKFFVFMNRAFADAESPHLTIDELVSRFNTFCAEELHPITDRVAKVTSKKSIAKALTFWRMLDEPRVWALESIKKAAIDHMRKVLGNTASIAAGRITLFDANLCLSATLDSIERYGTTGRASSRFNQPERRTPPERRNPARLAPGDASVSSSKAPARLGPGEASVSLSNAPMASPYKRRYHAETVLGNLIQTVRRTGVLTAAHYVSKLADVGISIVGKHNAERPTAKGLQATMLASLRRALKDSGLVDPAKLAAIQDLTQWREQALASLLREYRSVLFRHGMISFSVWRNHASAPSTVANDLANAHAESHPAEESLHEVLRATRSVATPAAMRMATNALPTELETRWLQALPQMARAAVEATSSGLLIPCSAAEAHTILKVLREVLSTARSFERHPSSMPRLEDSLEQYRYPAAFLPALQSADSLAAHDAHMLLEEARQDFAFLQHPPRLEDGTAPASWFDAFARWTAEPLLREAPPPEDSPRMQASRSCDGDTVDSINVVQSSPGGAARKAITIAPHDVDLEMGSASAAAHMESGTSTYSQTNASASVIRRVPSSEEVLAATPTDRVRLVGALTKSGVLRPLRRRCLHFALRLIGCLPTELAATVSDADAKLMIDVVRANQELLAPLAASAETAVPSLGMAATYASLVQKLMKAVEHAAVESLFIHREVEASVGVVSAYSFWRHPAMSILRVVAGSQLKVAKEMGKTFKTLWSVDPPLNPKQVVSLTLEKHGTPEMQDLFTRYYDCVMMWWRAKVDEHLPAVVTQRPRSVQQQPSIDVQSCSAE